MEKKIQRRLIVTVATVTISALAITAFHFMANRNSDSDIPLPFSQGKNFSLAGDLTKIGHRAADVYKVTFPTGVDSEKLTEDRIYLVYVPDEAGIADVPFDQVLTLDSDGSHNVDYFGYKYVFQDASIEKQHKNDPLLADRFPGQFFASAKARADDAQFGNSLANFERDNDIVMDPTDSSVGAALFRRGSLYFLIVNESGNVTITVRGQHAAAPSICGSHEQGGIVCEQRSEAECALHNGTFWNTTEECFAGENAHCGNGVKEGAEQCDDHNTTGGDGCSVICNVEANFSCTGNGPSVCITYHQFVLNLADTNHNGTVSENEALILTLDLADAPDKPYDTVKQFDINGDGVVDNADTTLIFGELDSLVPSSLCGNGVLDPGEECDNTTSDCDSTCHLTTPTPNI